MTDALGGVQVDIPAPFVSYHDQISFPAGPNTLDGKHALEFVRERYAFADGDYQRVRNQQAFVKALLAKNLSADTLLNPLKVHNVVSAMAPFISVDGGLDAATIAGLAVELKDVRPRDMVMFTLPTRGTGTSTDGQSIVLTDPRGHRRPLRRHGRRHAGRLCSRQRAGGRKLMPWRHNDEHPIRFRPQRS